MASLGERLRQGRDARGFSLQAVSNATKIREHILVSLEGDNYTALPAPVFVRGFLRTLARHLSLSSEELLALYAAVTSPAQAPEPEVQPSRTQKAKAQPIRPQPIKVQPVKGQPFGGRLARLQSSNGHSAETPPVTASSTDEHLPEPEPARLHPSNGHLAEVQPARPQPTNGHMAEPAVRPPPNGHLDESQTAAHAPANGHVAEPAPQPQASGHMAEPQPARLPPLNGHAAVPKAARLPAVRPHAAGAQPAGDSAQPRLALKLVRPGWVTPNVLMSGLIVLLLVAGVAWGGGQMLKGLEQSRPVKALQQAQPTIAALIQQQPTATPAFSLDPTRAAPTTAPNVAPAVPAAPTPLPVLRTLELKLDAVARTWLRVESDGSEAFQGILDAGASKGFTAHNRITMRAGNGGGVTVTVNGKLLGVLGASGDVVDKQWVLSDTGAVASATPVWTDPPVAPSPQK